MTFNTVDSFALTQTTGGQQATLDSLQESLDRIADKVAPWQEPPGNGAMHLERHYGRPHGRRYRDNHR